MRNVYQFDSNAYFLSCPSHFLERNYLEVYIYEKWSDKEILDYEEIRFVI